MNKRQRKKQETKAQRLQEEERQRQLEQLAQLPNIVSGWISKVNEFFFKTVAERPEQVRAYLLEKPGSLTEWERKLLQRAETEIEGRAKHDDQK